jgi:hypothetical protein
VFKDFTIVLESMNFSLNEPIEYHELNFIIHQSSIVKLLDKMSGQLKKKQMSIHMTQLTSKSINRCLYSF